LVKDWNLGWEKEYARLDERADPLFIEPKGYVFVGDSRTRMSMDNMPSIQEILEFATRMGEEMGMRTLKQRSDSRVCVIGTAGTETTIPRD
jgi:tRNA wybutosine-synthesizing protein 1